MLTMIRDLPDAAPVAVGSTKVAEGAHTVGYDAKSGNVWIVWSQASGDFVQAFRPGP